MDLFRADAAVASVPVPSSVRSVEAVPKGRWWWDTVPATCHVP
jgi:hypothetical protein